MDTVHVTPRAGWEHDLLRLALEGFEEQDARLVTPPVTERGYAVAEQITRENSKSFYIASGLLPQTKRADTRVLYAFCRVTDDLVDLAQGDASGALSGWRARALAEHPSPDEPLLVAWHAVRVRHSIPVVYVRQLIDGIALDLVNTRYATFDELARYCYGVASTVGLMAMHIIGYLDRTAIPYAVKLGVALQLTNILRDVGQDWAQGRLYLPQADLARFHYTETDLANGVIDERFRALMDFEIERAQQLYAEAWHGIRLLSGDGRLAIAAAADLYRGILKKIVQNRYDVFQKRAHLSAAEKLARVPQLWWRVHKM